MDLDHAASRQVAGVVRLVDDVLAAARLGTVLHGSAVAGGLRPASDLDLLVVVQRTLDDAERRALLAGLLAWSGTAAGGRPVELTVVVQADVRPWRFPPVADFAYGEWLRAAYGAGTVPGRATSPDVAVLLAVARSAGRSLAGPPPADLLDPVPGSDLARATRAGLPQLLADLDDDTRNVLLTLARVWATLSTGGVVPKDVAAAWAIERLPAEHRAVLAHARTLSRTTSSADEAWSDELRAGARPLAMELVARIAHLPPGPARHAPGSVGSAA